MTKEIQVLDQKSSGDAAGVTLEGQLASVADTRRPMRIGLWVLGLGFGGFLAWAALAPLDEGVPTPGMVSIDTKRKPVQHLTGGLVSEILVREGQMVEEGQVLARLDTAVARANFESEHQRYMGLRAMESRLLAEQAGASKIDFAPEVLASSDPMVQEQVATQRLLFATRRAALEAELAAIEQAIQGAEAMIHAYQGQLENHRLRRASLQEELAGIRSLVAEGYAPRNRQLDLERQLALTEAAIRELDGNIARAKSSIAESRQRAAARRLEYQKEGNAQLAQIRMELQASREKFKAAGDMLARTELRAPVAGQVVGLAVQTVGAVVQPGQKLMDIVPSSEPLLIEARIPPHLIDRVAVGQPTDIRFSGFAHSPVLVVEGRLDSVSQDLIVEPTAQGNAMYYLARVSLTPAGMQTLGARRLQPGMPVEVIIKTGERSLLKYLMSPLVKRIAAAMKEE